MNFKVKSIKKKKKVDERPFLAKKRAKILGAIAVLFLVTWGVKAMMGHDVSKGARLLFAPSPLKSDQYGKTNFVLLGVGGKMEEGGRLSDSIMIASLDTKKGSLALLSLPRDLFVSSPVGERKLNEVYAAARFKADGNDIKGLAAVKKALSDFTGVDIHYSAVINFRLFADIIDGLGGVEVFVPKDIVDPFYPDDDYAYQTFVIRKGKHELDGETALKYARSRKTTSDYDRAQRQQTILQAMIRKALDINLLGDKQKVQDFFELYKQNISSDLNLVEVLGLAKILIGVSFSHDDLVSHVLNDDPTQPGGLLYTPAKEFYGGHFVLLPQSLSDTQLFLHMTLDEPEILQEKAQIGVLNGSKEGGLASENAARLRRLGFIVIEIGNFESETPVFRTYVRDYTDGGKRKTLKSLNELYDFYKVEKVPPEAIPEDNLLDFEIIIGTN
ncbi:MAG TPA: LCP family protein [Candidatus Gracilibacteria bacterium]